MTIAKRNGGRHYSINPFLQAQRRCSRRICHRRCALARPSCAFEENYTVGRDPAAARARQPKMESEAEGAHDFGSSLARAQVGGVSPRPPNRGRSCTLLGREPLLEAKALGLTGRWFAGDPAVSERRALPARSLDRHLMLTRMGSRRTESGFAGYSGCEHLAADDSQLGHH